MFSRSTLLFMAYSRNQNTGLHLRRSFESTQTSHDTSFRSLNLNELTWNSSALFLSSFLSFQVIKGNFSSCGDVIGWVLNTNQLFPFFGYTSKM